MQLHSPYPRHTHKTHAPVGRGGRRGKTSGRGGKGQTARAGHKIRPEMRDTIKKLPKRRGYGTNRSSTVRHTRLIYSVVNLGDLDMCYAVGEIVTPASLVARGLVRRTAGRSPAVKILGRGSLTKALVIRGCILSASALAALASSGGTTHV